MGSPVPGSLPVSPVQLPGGPHTVTVSQRAVEAARAAIRVHATASPVGPAGRPSHGSPPGAVTTPGPAMSPISVVSVEGGVAVLSLGPLPLDGSRSPSLFAVRGASVEPAEGSEGGHWHGAAAVTTPPGDPRWLAHLRLSSGDSPGGGSGGPGSASFHEALGHVDAGTGAGAGAGAGTGAEVGDGALFGHDDSAGAGHGDLATSASAPSLGAGGRSLESAQGRRPEDIVSGLARLVTPKSGVGAVSHCCGSLIPSLPPSIVPRMPCEPSWLASACPFAHCGSARVGS